MLIQLYNSASKTIDLSLDKDGQQLKKLEIIWGSGKTTSQVILFKNPVYNQTINIMRNSVISN